MMQHAVLHGQEKREAIMTRKRREIVHVNQEDEGQPCDVSDAKVNREISHWMHRGWQLESRDPVDPTKKTKVVKLTFKKQRPDC
jgi:hypothetical protein